MKGCRDLSDDEFEQLMDYFADNDQLRDRTLFSVQRWAGYRISEALSLKVKDVFHMKHSGQIECVDRIHIDPRHMKGGKKPRRIIVHERLREDLMEYLEEIRSDEGFGPGMYLFQSRKGTNKAISYVQAWRVLKKAYEALDIRENVATHSLRKTFANRVYENTGHDIIATMNIMDHSSPSVTLAYINVDQDKLEQAVLAQ